MKEKEVAHIVQEPRKSELVKACYGIVGAMFEVYKQLGPGMPEYIYQEALSKEIVGAGMMVHKEMQYHPLYKGAELEAYLKMDLVVETEIGNVLNVAHSFTLLNLHHSLKLLGWRRMQR